MENTTKQRRSSIKIMGKMIGLVKPLAHIMIAAVLLGSLGYLCAISLTITAGHSVLLAMKGQPVTKYLIILVVLAVMRGILHYAEQYCNHFIAFKLLAIIRHQVFAVLRKLCPAKLDGRRLPGHPDAGRHHSGHQAHPLQADARGGRRQDRQGRSHEEDL